MSTPEGAAPEGDPAPGSASAPHAASAPPVVSPTAAAVPPAAALPVPGAAGAASAPSTVTITGGVVQGLVIGRPNTVTQHFHQAPPSAFAPREAPVLPDRVVGRDALLAALTSALTTGTPPRTTALYGMGGIGKSTLAALFAASPAALEAFPDGHFWVDLRDGDAMDALARMAQSCGHPVDAYLTVEARSRAVRSMLAQRRVLIVADDARTEEEVLPFLPAHPDSAVLVTTRDEGVASALTDRLVAVDRLDTASGVSLLEELAGLPDSPQDAVLPELVEELGGLPLALELVGKQARKEARRPGFSWAALRSRYLDADQRLGLARGERGVRTAFEQSWSESLDPDGQRSFALLGIFPGAELLTGEIAAAWNEDDGVVRAGLGELLDLSLLRQVDAVTLRLHPLLKDFAGEKAQEIPLEERREAHCRVADFHFQRATPTPATFRDIQPVLSSHLHACAAGDRERARRVFPWFGSVPVPGFLLDRGFITARIHHLELDLAFAREEGPIPEAYALYWFAHTLGEAGRNAEAITHLQRALDLIAGLPDQTVAVVPAARGKFSYRLGQLLAETGELERARQAYGTALADDQAQGQDTHALVTMLQVGDLWLKQGDEEGERQARATFVQARELARRGGHGAEEAMALARLADRLKREDPDGTLTCIQEALRLDEPHPPRPLPHETQESGESRAAAAAADERPEPVAQRVWTPAFASRQGARYATYLGRIAAELAHNHARALPLAITAYTIALRRASDADAVTQQAEVLYWMGHLFEHLFLIPGHEPEYLAAAACYAHSAHMVESMEAPPPIHPRQRLETRILPRLDPETREGLALRLEEHPLAVVQEAIDRILAR